MFLRHFLGYIVALVGLMTLVAGALSFLLGGGIGAAVAGVVGILVLFAGWALRDSAR